MVAVAMEGGDCRNDGKLGEEINWENKAFSQVSNEREWRLASSVIDVANVARPVANRKVWR